MEKIMSMWIENSFCLPLKLKRKYKYTSPMCITLNQMDTRCHDFCNCIYFSMNQKGHKSLGWVKHARLSRELDLIFIVFGVLRTFDEFS